MTWATDAVDRLGEGSRDTATAVAGDDPAPDQVRGEIEGLRVGARVLVAPEAVIEYKDKLRAAAHAGEPAA